MGEICVHSEKRKKMEYQKCRLFNHETVRRIDEDAEVYIKRQAVGTEGDEELYYEEYHFKTDKILPEDLYISCEIDDKPTLLVMVEEDGVRFGRPLKMRKQKQIRK